MSSTATTIRRPRPGRPRLIPAPDDSVSARDQILDASARLFVYQGYAATSTREIAEKVGMRQASMYHYFAGKDEILADLLKRSIRPTLDKVAQIEDLCAQHPPETALYLLLLIDVRTLATAPHNTGFLAKLPEVRRSPAYEEYDKVRRELAEAYGRLGHEVAARRLAGAEPRFLGEWLLNLVEVVIVMRRSRCDIDEATEAGIAASGLRMCGADQHQIDIAVRQAEELIDQL